MTVLSLTQEECDKIKRLISEREEAYHRKELYRNEGKFDGYAEQTHVYNVRVIEINEVLDALVLK